MQQVVQLIPAATVVIIPAKGNALIFNNNDLVQNVDFHIGLNDFVPSNTAGLHFTTVGGGETPVFPDFTPFYQIQVFNRHVINDFNVIFHYFTLPDPVFNSNAIKRNAALRGR